MPYPGEIWKKIPGFPNYEASSFGRVRSLERRVRCLKHGKEATRLCPGKILAQIPHRGYVVTRIGDNGKFKLFGVHQIVALAFHGLPMPGYVVDHVDTNKLNNRPSNLEYVTNSENVKRQYKTGLLSNKGELHGGSKLTNLQASKILRFKGRVSAKKLSQVFSVSEEHIRRIWAGTSRQHLSE